MINRIKRFLGMKRLRRGMSEIAPDEIFLDSSNLPQFDVHQFQGRLDQPIGKSTIIGLLSVFLLFGIVFVSRIGYLQIYKGEAYAERSENNRLRETDVFSNRGVIFDRNMVPLAFNTIPGPDREFSLRGYATTSGIAHVVGFIKYPVKDSSGFYFRKNFIGEAGIEAIMDETLAGKNGVRIVETDALGNIQSESVSRRPVDGKNVNLTIDSKVSDALYGYIEETAGAHGFSGGAGVIMDVESGEILALANFPEYNSSLVTEGDAGIFASYQKDSRNPFLNRVIAGLYTPGSIVKPILAIGALEEKIIDPNKQILSTGSISLANPFFPDKPSIFKDWKAHGWVDMRKAIAVSSDVYFYAIGGGFEDQKGLGISRVEKYFRMFGMGEKTGTIFSSEKEGTIPNPEWKEKMFDGDIWRIGDTYNTSIGQYGVQITPLQAVRFIAAIANRGKLVNPTLTNAGEKKERPVELSIEEKSFDIVHEGMRAAVNPGGTASGLNLPFVKVAAKTGTAELGALKQYVHSWTVGFFPYEKPRYAFAVLMERGPRTNLVGASFIMRQLLEWMSIYTPEYLKTID